MHLKTKAPSLVSIWYIDSPKSDFCSKMRKINIFISDFGRRFFVQMSMNASGDVLHSIVLIHRMILMLHEVQIRSIGKSALVYVQKSAIAFRDFEK